jgi:hypothetical protein
VDKNITENIITLPPVRLEKRIGNTTFIISSGFNGDKSRDIVKSLARLMERDSLNADNTGKN